MKLKQWREWRGKRLQDLLNGSHEDHGIQYALLTFLDVTGRGQGGVTPARSTPASRNPTLSPSRSRCLLTSAQGINLNEHPLDISVKIKWVRSHLLFELQSWSGYFDYNSSDRMNWPFNRDRKNTFCHHSVVLSGSAYCHHVSLASSWSKALHKAWGDGPVMCVVTATCLFANVHFQHELTIFTVSSYKG